MNILLIGSGGREHALAWAIAASPLTDRLVIAPGSDAMAQIGTCVDIAVDDQAALLALADDEGPDLIVIGPEGPLVAGLFLASWSILQEQRAEDEDAAEHYRTKVDVDGKVRPASTPSQAQDA